MADATTLAPDEAPVQPKHPRVVEALAEISGYGEDLREIAMAASRAVAFGVNTWEQKPQQEFDMLVRAKVRQVLQALQDLPKE